MSTQDSIEIAPPLGESTELLHATLDERSASRPAAGKSVLIIVENLPVPFDRRVWSEAQTLFKAGYEVSIICPKGQNASASYEIIEGIHIYRHPLPAEGNGALGYLQEYACALFWEFVLSVKVRISRGFDVIHACNPPDLIFLVAAFHKIFGGKRFVFDHHDLNPELYEAKFGRRDFYWKLMRLFERLTFATAHISIATNESYREVALERGQMKPDRVFVVRSGPNLGRVRQLPPDDYWKEGRKYLVGYVGVIGKQEGVDLYLEAIAHIRHHLHRDDVHFTIVGSGPELTALIALAKDYKVDDVVTFTGRVDDETLLTILSTADVCVNPDRPNVMNDKSSMNKIMEYMALGKPMVQFDLAEGRFSARESSLYARCTDTEDFGNKIIELLDDPVRRQKMGEFGRRRVLDHLSWDHEGPKLLTAYQAVMNK
jgi:glycosyltransferase involved in cell wall biosynthesis